MEWKDRPSNIEGSGEVAASDVEDRGGIGQRAVVMYAFRIQASPFQVQIWSDRPDGRPGAVDRPS
jgi:hypothetical protein